MKQRSRDAAYFKPSIFIPRAAPGFLRQGAASSKEEGIGEAKGNCCQQTFNRGKLAYITFRGGDMSVIFVV